MNHAYMHCQHWVGGLLALLSAALFNSTLLVQRTGAGVGAFYGGAASCGCTSSACSRASMWASEGAAGARRLRAWLAMAAFGQSWAGGAGLGPAAHQRARVPR